MNEIQYYAMEESAAMSQVYAELESAFKKVSTERWDWDRITCCLTSKDADLDPWGCQGLELVSQDEDNVTVIVHAYKTFAGNDVCLNFPTDADLEDNDYTIKILDVWMEQAELTVQGCGSAGEWDGDSWIMTFEEELSVPWAYTNNEMDYDLTVQNIVEAANALLKPWEDEIGLADKFLSQLAGWRGANDESLPEGKPDMELSVFNPLYIQGE